MILKFISVQDILEFAYFEEQKAISYIQILNKQLPRKMRKTLQLFENEKNNRLIFISNLKLENFSAIQIQNLESIAIDNYQAWNLSPNLSLQNSEQTVVVLIEMTKHLIRFYNQLAVNIFDENQVVLFKKYANEELNHIKQFETWQKEIKEKNSKPKLKDNKYWIKFNFILEQFSKLGLALFCSILFERFFEAFAIPYIFNFTEINWQQTVQGLPFDSLLFLGISGILVIPFFVIFWFKPKIANYFYYTISIFILIINILLINYLAKAQLIIGSVKEYPLIISSFKTLKPWIYTTFLIFPAIYLLLVFLLKKQSFPQKTTWIFCLLSIASLYFVLKTQPNPSHFKMKENYLLTINKTTYLIDKTLDFKHKAIEINSAKQIDETRIAKTSEYFSKEFTFAPEVKRPYIPPTLDTLDEDDD